ncbi:unnamed protein product [Darwinula stevensoni]|uniref:Uncharacterized protein n=1 Tax=Darwinula stevensoni TaxID=69355 RepID=A0A7R8X404_9CRUS|nr:unnamed protein product [Darwinula stevensoni]CAG0885526.1 unnamed protein product [Darwinula stevensoni]
MVSETSSSSYRHEVMSSSSAGKQQNWDGQLNKLLDDLQTNMSAPGGRGEMNSHGLYGIINSPGRVTKHSREEYISPDKKAKYFSEKYEWQSEIVDHTMHLGGSGAGSPKLKSPGYVKKTYYSSRYDSDGVLASPASERRLTFQDAKPQGHKKSYRSFVDEEFLTKRSRSQSPGAGPVVTSTPYGSTNRRHEESNVVRSVYNRSYDDEPLDPSRHKYSPSDPSYQLSSPKTPRRTASLDRRYHVEKYGVRNRESSLPRNAEYGSGSYAKKYQHQSYQGQGSLDRMSRRDYSPSSTARRRDASPIRPGYGQDGDLTHTDIYQSIDRSTTHRSRRSWGREDSPSPTRLRSGESRSRSPSRSPSRPRRDASPIRPGYGSDADPSNLVRQYNYQYMWSSREQRSPSPDERERERERRLREERERLKRSPSLPRKFPTNLTTPDAGVQRPPKEVQELMASISSSSTTRDARQGHGGGGGAPPPPPAPSSELIHRREKEKSSALVESQNKAGSPVYYPPSFHDTLKKKEEQSGQVVPMWHKEKEKEKGKWKYGTKSKDSERAMAVPLCLPLCCAAPLCCTIM